MLNLSEINIARTARKIDALLHNVNVIQDKERGSVAGRRLARALLMLSSLDRDMFLNCLELQLGKR